MIYLDYAAATPLDEQVLMAMQPYFSNNFFNPSAIYGPAKEVQLAILAARKEVAAWLGAKSTEIVFTTGVTEANNLALKGVLNQFPDTNVVVSAVEHESVLKPAGGYTRKIVPVDPSGSVNLQALTKAIDNTTVLVSVMYANNEVGTIQPLHEISQNIAQIRKQRALSGNRLPLYLHSDAAQAANYLDLHVARLGVDLLSVNGGKAYGPKQTGILYVKTGVILRPLIIGGGQENGRRSGTENVSGIIGFAKALTIAQQQRHDESQRLQRLQHQFISQLKGHIPSISINGTLSKRLPNNVHVTFPIKDNERLLMQLSARHIYAAAGSACSASNDDPSHVLKAMGLSDEAARASIRFSFGRQTDEAAIKKTVSTLVSLVA